jgi:DNA modification methylase
MIAAEQMKRRAFLSEVDPVFATLIINRYEKLTGDKAKRIS